MNHYWVSTLAKHPAENCWSPSGARGGGPELTGPSSSLPHPLLRDPNQLLVIVVHLERKKKVTKKSILC